jgi:hypothetical protein
MEINKTDFYRQPEFHDLIKYDSDDSAYITDLKQQLLNLKFAIDRYERQYPGILDEHNKWLSDEYTMMDLIELYPWPFASIFQVTDEDSRMLKQGTKFLQPEEYTQQQKNQLVHDYIDDVLAEIHRTLEKWKRSMYEIKNKLDAELEREKIQKAKQLEKAKIQKQKEEEQRIIKIEEEKKKQIKRNLERGLAEGILLQDEIISMISGEKPIGQKGRLSGRSTKTKSKSTIKTIATTRIISHTELEDWRSFVEGRKKRCKVDRGTASPLDPRDSIILSHTPPSPQEIESPQIEVPQIEYPTKQIEVPQIEYPTKSDVPQIEDLTKSEVPQIEYLTKSEVPQTQEISLLTLELDNPYNDFYLVPLDPKTNVEMTDLAIKIPYHTTRILGRNDWPSLANNYVSREAVEVKNDGKLFVKASKQKYVTYEKHDEQKRRMLGNDYIQIDNEDVLTILKDVLIVKIKLSSFL